MTDIIKHTGIIEEIKGYQIKVKIVQSSACSACKAHKLCSAAESKEKMIDVFDRNPSEHFVGEHVTLLGTTAMGLQAVWLGFAIPFILLVGVLFLSMSLTGQSEGWSALISILSVALYYLILSRFKERLSKKFSFTIDSK
ncbi:MAG: SoxR reducing system RseC family protein [Phocaeicola sp.]|nr:SoxR reducing system RseC family protein [Phocaeicola sp.]MBR1596018.1 SoxR reducing system RseC family protein [Phocaeicola sp.]MBR1719900.1 SoxR reducing system RseC family protein [Phocaeicola sp.]